MGIDAKPRSPLPAAAGPDSGAAPPARLPQGRSWPDNAPNGRGMVRQSRGWATSKAPPATGSAVAAKGGRR